MRIEFKNRIVDYQKLIETELGKALNGVETKVGEAVRYSALNGGKRVRGILVLEFCNVFGGDIEKAAYIAASIEMLHAFSLIHDDLPCMDNDDLRRGKPSCHKQFGEATALLAGDALLALAYNNASALALIPNGLKPEKIVKITSVMSSATSDMISGQQLDADYETKTDIDEENILAMYNRKTAALISASCVCGALCANANEKRLHSARGYGYALGLTFQIIDDLLDLKTEKKNKKTLPLIIGEKKAKKLASEYTDTAVKTAELLPNGGFLKEFALDLIERKI